MDKIADLLLRRLLKNWANRPSPPEHGRERLLIKAAAIPRHKININILNYRPQFNSYPLTYSNDWPQTFFTWINQNSYQAEFQARLREYAY